MPQVENGRPGCFFVEVVSKVFICSCKSDGTLILHPDFASCMQEAHGSAVREVGWKGRDFHEGWFEKDGSQGSMAYLRMERRFVGVLDEQSWSFRTCFLFASRMDPIRTSVNEGFLQNLRTSTEVIWEKVEGRKFVERLVSELFGHGWLEGRFEKAWDFRKCSRHSNIFSLIVRKWKVHIVTIFNSRTLGWFCWWWEILRDDDESEIRLYGCHFFRCARFFLWYNVPRRWCLHCDTITFFRIQ